MLDFLQLFDLVVNNTTSTFSPEETEICGVEYVYIFRANTPTNLTLFFPSSDELASEKLLWYSYFILPSGGQTLRQKAGAAKPHRKIL